MAVKLPYTDAQQEQIGAIKVRELKQVLVFRCLLYVLLVGYALVLVSYSIILVITFCLKLAGGVPNLSWTGWLGLSAGTAGLGAASPFFTKVLNKLLRS